MPHDISITALRSPSVRVAGTLGEVLVHPLEGRAVVGFFVGELPHHGFAGNRGGVMARRLGFYEGHRGLEVRGLAFGKGGEVRLGEAGDEQGVAGAHSRLKRMSGLALRSVAAMRGRSRKAWPQGISLRRKPLGWGWTAMSLRWVVREKGARVSIA